MLKTLQTQEKEGGICGMQSIQCQKGSTFSIARGIRGGIFIVLWLKEKERMHVAAYKFVGLVGN